MNRLFNKCVKTVLTVIGVVLYSSAFAQNFGAQNSNDFSYSFKKYPASAKKDEALLLVERKVPKAIRPNQEYTFEIKVSNKSFYKLDEVIITEYLPENFTLVKAFPAAQTRNKVLKWDLGMMAPGQSDVFIITGKATSPGSMQHRGEAEINSDLGSLAAIMEVVEPVLQFRVTAPSEVILSEDIPVKIQFRNGGNSPVVKAVLKHTFSRGLGTEKGETSISLPVGNLQPNEVKTFDLVLKASQVGIYDNKFVATATDGVSASASMKISVQQPKLKIEASAPDHRFVGNVVTFKTKITNTGSAAAKDVVCTLPLPNGTEFSSADEGGKLINGQVSWNLGTLQPGEDKEFKARIKATKIMIVQSNIYAEAKGANKVQAPLVTDIKGIPAFRLMVNDVNDPVPVGDTEQYVVYIENQGSKVATGVVVKCILEDSMEFVKSDGIVKSKLVGNVLTFEAIKGIEPKDFQKLKVWVRAKKHGDVRFTAEVTSNELSRPVRENESTTFYE